VAAQRRVAATRTRFSTRGPKSQRGTVLRFRLRRPGTVELVVRSGCEVVGQRRVHGRSGVNRVPFRGRVHGRALPPGRYTVTVVVVRGGSRARVGTVAIEVVPPGRHLTRAERSAPVRAGCVATTSPGSAVLASLAAPLSARSSGGGGKPATPKAVVPRRTGVFGASFKPPPLPPVIGEAGGRLGWFGLVVYFLLGAAGAAIVIYVARFFRGSWDP
jgi:hypothetical protein